MATDARTTPYTGFTVGAVIARFGLLWPQASNLMTDWARESRVVELPGASGLTETQLLGFGPYKATYEVWFATPDDYRALDALVQQTGTLTIVHDAHTLPDDGDDGTAYAPQTQTAYDRIANVTLLSLASSGTWGDRSVEAIATFSRGSA